MAMGKTRKDNLNSKDRFEERVERKRVKTFPKKTVKQRGGASNWQDLLQTPEEE